MSPAHPYRFASALLFLAACNGRLIEGNGLEESGSDGTEDSGTEDSDTGDTNDPCEFGTELFFEDFSLLTESDVAPFGWGETSQTVGMEHASIVVDPEDDAEAFLRVSLDPNADHYLYGARWVTSLDSESHTELFMSYRVRLSSVAEPGLLPGLAETGTSACEDLTDHSSRPGWGQGGLSSVTSQVDMGLGTQDCQANHWFVPGPMRFEAGRWHDVVVWVRQTSGELVLDAWVDALSVGTVSRPVPDGVSGWDSLDLSALGRATEGAPAVVDLDDIRVCTAD